MLVEGYASTPSVDHARDIVLPGAFAESIAERGLSGPRGIKLLAQHDQHKPIGRILKLEQGRDGLWMEADIDESISYAADLANAIRANDGLSYSIGYRLVPGFIEYRKADDVFLISKVNLHEISVVTFACNEDCQMRFPKSFEQKLADTIAEMKALANPYASAMNAAAELKEVLR